MNTPEIDKPKWKSNIANFASDIFDVLWTNHESKYNNRKNKQLDYFERLSNVVKEVRMETGFDYSDIDEYKRRLLADNKKIEETKEKLRNNKKLKPLFEELKTIPWKSKWMENKIWRDIFWDLLYESMENKIWRDIFWDLLYESMENVWEEDEWEEHNFCGKLRKKTVEELKEVFKVLPKGLKYLDFCVNDLWERTVEEIKEIFSILPKDLKNFNLSDNKLWEKTGKEIKTIFSILPKGLKILNLWNNKLWKNSWEDLKEALSVLPKGIKILYLSVNDLWKKTVEELKEVFSGLPKGLKTLNMQFNNLWDKEDKIRQYCESIWINVTIWECR